MKKIFITLLIFMISIFMIYCEENPNKHEKKEECIKYGGDYIKPIELDNYWIFSQKSYANGEPDYRDPDTLKEIIESMIEVKIGNIDYIGRVSQMIYPDNNYREVSAIQWNGPKGLYDLGMITPTDTFLIEPILRYKYPVNIGEKWNVSVISYGYDDERISIIDTMTIRCVAKDYQFITPVDTFRTIVYYYAKEIAEGALYLRHCFMYYCPGISMVGAEFYQSTDSIYYFDQKITDEMHIRIELIDYCLKLKEEEL